MGRGRAARSGAGLMAGWCGASQGLFWGGRALMRSSEDLDGLKGLGETEPFGDGCKIDFLFVLAVPTTPPLRNENVELGNRNVEFGAGKIRPRKPLEQGACRALQNQKKPTIIGSCSGPKTGAPVGISTSVTSIF